MKDLKRRREGDDAENSTMQLALPNRCGLTQEKLIGYDASTAVYKAFFKNKDAVNGRRGWRCRSREAIWCP